MNEFSLENSEGKPTIIEFGPLPLMNEFEPDEVGAYIGLDRTRPAKYQTEAGLGLATKPADTTPPSAMGVASLTDRKFLESEALDNSADIIVAFNVFSVLDHDGNITQALPDEAELNRTWSKLYRMLKSNGVVLIGEWYTPDRVNELLDIDFESFGFRKTIIRNPEQLAMLRDTLRQLHLKSSVAEGIVTKWKMTMRIAAHDRTWRDKLLLRPFNPKSLPFLIVLQRV